MAGFKQISKDNLEVNFRYIDYLGNNIRVRKREFRTKKEAKNFSEDYISKMNGTSNVLFRTAFEEYIEHKSNFIKSKTLSTLKSLYKVHIKGYFQDLQLKEIDDKMIAKLFYSLETDSIYKDCRKTLNGFFEYTALHFGTKVNIKNIKINIKLPHRTFKTGNICTFEEFNKFEKLFTEKRIKFKLFYKILYFSGARAGEICALTPKDINFKNNTININKTRTGSETTNSPKTKSSIRKIKMPKSIMLELKEYLDKYTVLPTFIFSTYNTYKDDFKRFINKNNLKKINLHDLRHSHASFLIKNGIDIASISKRLGHSNVNITLSTYSHFYDNKKDDIVELLDNRLD